MATFTFSSFSSRSLGAALMLLLGLSIANLAITDAEVGVCYGMMGNNLPNHWDVVGMYKQHNIRRMRLYDPNHGALQALRDSGIEVMLGVPNGDLQRLSNQGDANWWVQKNVLDFWPNVKFRYIAVGNEVSPVGGSAWAAKFVLPAIVSIFNAIRAAGLQDKIKVSTAIDTTLIGVSYPPSAGAFRNDVKPYLEPILGHLQYAKTPLLANIYTYFSHIYNPGVISLSYALFKSPNVVVWDNGKGYQNLFDAMLDSLYSALEKIGAGGSLDVVVSETGWPSEGGVATSFDNAGTYLWHFIQHVKKGTPKRPRPFEAYLFAMFNENQKEPAYEKNFGLFFPNKQAKYNLNFGGTRDEIKIIDSANETMAFRSDI